MAFAVDYLTAICTLKEMIRQASGDWPMADAPRIPVPPRFAPAKGCDYCGTVHQEHGRCVSCGAPRRERPSLIPVQDMVAMLGHRNYGRVDTGPK